MCPLLQVQFHMTAMGVSDLTQRPSSFSVAGIYINQNQLGEHGFILVSTSMSQLIVLGKSWLEFKQEPKQKPRRGTVYWLTPQVFLHKEPIWKDGIAHDVGTS